MRGKSVGKFAAIVSACPICLDLWPLIGGQRTFRTDRRQEIALGGARLRGSCAGTLSKSRYGVSIHLGAQAAVGRSAVAR
jgi:hypothetical protein